MREKLHEICRLRLRLFTFRIIAIKLLSLIISRTIYPLSAGSMRNIIDGGNGAGGRGVRKEILTEIVATRQYGTT